MTKTPATGKRLSADALFQNIHQSFQGIRDPRTGRPSISLADALMSGLAMFALKDPSMLAFDQPGPPLATSSLDYNGAGLWRSSASWMTTT